jgi:hypothetical protein
MSHRGEKRGGKRGSEGKPEASMLRHWCRLRGGDPVKQKIPRSYLYFYLSADINTDTRSKRALTPAKGRRKSRESEAARMCREEGRKEGEEEHCLCKCLHVGPRATASQTAPNRRSEKKRRKKRRASRLRVFYTLLLILRILLILLLVLMILLVLLLQELGKPCTMSPRAVSLLLQRQRERYVSQDGIGAACNTAATLLQHC